MRFKICILCAFFFFCGGCNPLSGNDQKSELPPLLDIVAPTASFSALARHTDAIPNSVTLSFSEKVYGLKASDFEIIGETCKATLSSLDFDAGATEATLHLGGDLDHFGDLCTLKLSAGAVSDEEGNLLAGDLEISVAVDVISQTGTVVNDYTYMTDASVSAGASSLTVHDASALTAGDRLLIVQMQDSASPALAGTYEFATLASKSGNQLTLSSPLASAYVSGTFNTTSSKVTQVIRVPSVEQLQVLGSGSLTAPSWDGFTGGIVVVESDGEMSIEGAIDVSGLGFRGGSVSSNFVCADLPSASGQQGESVAGKGSVSVSAKQGGGGGGNSGECSFGGYVGAAGGAGGGYGADGEDRSAWTSSPEVIQGTEGAGYGVSDLSRISLGSGGGGGGSHDDGQAGAGGAGGGVVILKAQTITVTGSISAAGAHGTDCASPGGSGGGGSGGSVYLEADTSVSVGSLLVSAVGGEGGEALDGEANPDYRNGGDGGDGRIKLVAPSITGTTDPISPP
jgi:hypothetical protein